MKHQDYGEPGNNYDNIRKGAIVLAKREVKISDISSSTTSLGINSDRDDDFDYCDCFQRCIYFNENFEIREGFIHINYLQPIEKDESLYFWDKDKTNNVKFFTKDGSDAILPYSVFGEKILVKQGTNATLRRKSDDNNNNSFWIKVMDKNGRIWIFPLTKELVDNFLQSINSEGQAIIHDFMYACDERETRGLEYE